MSITIDRLVRSRRRTVALVVERDGTLTVRAPLHMARENIHTFVEAHQGWVEKHRQKALEEQSYSNKSYKTGETFLFLGKSYPLTIVASQRSSLAFTGKAFYIARSALPEAGEYFVHWYKKQARQILFERVRSMAVTHGLNYQKIRISSARTRWGSCSSSGTLSFTYRLIMAPLEVVDYVILHELVHTQVRNHSRKFWDRLASLMPDYKRRLTWLKKNGKFLV
jgi:predicted metal-dependent hydrolase